MNRPPRLDEAALAAALAKLPAWSIRDAKLYRAWRFPDFSQAFAFVTRVALLAERFDHHPEWRNSYGEVEIWLATHVSSGITARDIALAAAIDALDGQPQPCA
ncbi:MAG: 4a-hydroxytetrahydrobiopterin dehydratase [Spongiibacteraceae bacterium]|jgi:4a-hydroxytetrahydrobiopterin dehydratase|nr:4a-hydroxytetrahydrobiopterin dehydratase [Spongiibacteraceae bacterium]